MCNALQLLATLLALAKDGNQDVAEAVEEHWKELGDALWSCFTKEKGNMEVHLCIASSIYLTTLIHLLYRC